jgi:hypothetical protein
MKAVRISGERDDVAASRVLWHGLGPVHGAPANPLRVWCESLVGLLDRKRPHAPERVCD